MSFFGRTKKIIKPFVDIPRWMGFGQLVKTNRDLFSLAKKCFVPSAKGEASAQESFSAALIRLNLSEADLAQRIKEFRRLQWLWTGLLLISFTYSIYLLSEHALRGFFPCLGFSFVIATQVFRYHFWIFQIQHRRLGCTFRDWLNTRLLLLSGKKTP